MVESAVAFHDADEVYVACVSRYRHELKRLVRSGVMKATEFEDLAYDNKLDDQKFPELKKLLDRLNEAYKTTKRGIAERKAAAADSPIVAPFVESTDETNPLDERLLAELPKHVGKASAAELAKLFDTDLISFMVSFRRVRGKLDGIRGYECLHDGQLGIELVKDET